MKKIIISFLLLITFSSFLVGQETNSTVESSAKQNISFRLGGEFSDNIPVGTLNNYVSNYIGGAVIGELDFGLPLPDFIAIGASAKIGFNGGFIKDDIILSMWNMQIAPGIYSRFILGNGAFIIQPEISYGVQMNFVAKNPEYSNKVDNLYVDQMIEASVSFRFSPAKLLNRALEFGITPFYTLCPEKNNIAQFAGANFCILYNF